MTEINEHDDTEAPATADIDNDAAVDAVSEEEIVAEVKQARKQKSRDTAPTEIAQRGPAVVSSAMTDDVRLDSCVFENMYARKSLTIHHLQRRLAELGYADALTDRDGWYGSITRDAVASWQSDNGIEGDGMMTEFTFTEIFKGDINVNTIV